MEERCPFESSSIARVGERVAGVKRKALHLGEGVQRAAEAADGQNTREKSLCCIVVLRPSRLIGALWGGREVRQCRLRFTV